MSAPDIMRRFKGRIRHAHGVWLTEHPEDRNWWGHDQKNRWVTSYARRARRNGFLPDRSHYAEVAKFAVTFAARMEIRKVAQQSLKEVPKLTDRSHVVREKNEEEAFKNSPQFKFDHLNVFRF